MGQKLSTQKKIILKLTNPDKRILKAGLNLYDKSIEQFQQQLPLKQRLEAKQQLKIETLKRNKASSQIGKFVRNNTQFKNSQKTNCF